MRRRALAGIGGTGTAVTCKACVDLAVDLLAYIKLTPKLTSASGSS